MYYLTEPDPLGAMGLGGKEERNVDGARQLLTAIDYRTGKIAWQHRFRTIANTGLAQVLTTAGRSVVRRRCQGQLRRVRSGEGTPLWHTQLGQVPSNAAADI